MENVREEHLTVTPELVQITTKTKYLSPSELTTLRNLEIPNVTGGLKRTKVENTEEEHCELERLYGKRVQLIDSLCRNVSGFICSCFVPLKDQLKRQLCRPRIERLSGRAVGVWDPEHNLVRVQRKDGKFGNFGFSIDGQLYLEYYEAMFLLELNRLQLEYHSTIVSIEQAYILLMGEQQSPKYNEYLVYSNLTRVGYILVKHRNVHFQKHQINNEIDCVWAILDAELHEECVADYIKKTQYYPKVKEKFDRIKSIITHQELVTKENDEEGMAPESELTFSGRIKPYLKRSATANVDQENQWHTAKRHCNYGAEKIFQRSLVDFLKDEDEYKQFKKIFEQFDMVPLKMNVVQGLSQEQELAEQPEDNEETETETETEDELVSAPCPPLHINFDVYLHNEGFRKSSPHLPNFRVIILQPDAQFPTHDQIFRTHRQQLNPVPLLIVSVNDSKQMQAFLYYFS